jgi:glycosyltransferase involved in cell wall biosynthesis
MVSTEYPPMHGGVGRFTNNLVKALRSKDLKVIVVSDSHGSGDYDGISPNNRNNSEVLLKLVQEIKPDIVHVQHEHGLYGFYLNPLYPLKTSTGLDRFYDKCTTPIVTTFHTSMYFKQWMQLINTKDAKSKLIRMRLRVLYKYWRQFINYSSLHRVNRNIMSKSAHGIVFSDYMRNLIPGAKVIHHGSEPFFQNDIPQIQARRKLGLPPKGRLALAQGFFTSTKGWDIIKKIKMPANWKLVVNYSRNFYNEEDTQLDLENKNKNQVINLNKDYLSEEELSLLFFSCDAMFLPYKVSSGSGIMYDGLGHGKPFIASDLGFFKEFSALNLGIISKRDSHEFEQAFISLDKNYRSFESSVMEFRKKLRWEEISKQHIDIYNRIVEKPKMTLKVVQYAD